MLAQRKVFTARNYVFMLGMSTSLLGNGQLDNCVGGGPGYKLLSRPSNSYVLAGRKTPTFPLIPGKGDFGTGRTVGL